MDRNMITILKGCLLPLIMVCCFQAQAQPPHHVWAKSMGGPGNEAVNGMVMDTAGNIFITGYFYSGGADFDPGTGIAELEGKGGNDIFIARYDPQGNYVWAASVGGLRDQYSEAIGVDAAGNIYITGRFQDTVDFDPGTGTAELIATGNNFDRFIAKYDGQGNYIWAKQLSNTATNLDMAVDAAGNMHITGYFTGTTDFNPASGVTNNLVSKGSADIFIAKYDSSGNYVWAYNMGSNNTSRQDRGMGITLDDVGNIYVTGYFFGTADFATTGTVPAELVSNGGISDIFLAKYDNNGNYIWAKGLGGLGRDEGNGIAVDAAGNVYVTGYHIGKADFNPATGAADTFYLYGNSSSDVFVAKYDNAGNYVWARGIASKGGDAGNSVAVNAAGDVYVTGDFSDTAYFSHGGSPAELIPNGGNNDIFIATYDAAGNYIWAKNFGGAPAHTLSESGVVIMLDAAGDAIIAGRYLDSADFDPGTGEAMLVSEGGAEIFLLKLSEHCTLYTNFLETTCDSFLFNGVTYTATGIYADTFTSVGLCDSIVTLDLTVYTTPEATVTASGSVLTASEGDGYHWLNCDNGTPVPEAGSRSYTAIQSGRYAVIVTNNSCSDTSECVSVIGTGISETEAGHNIQLYPNPVHDLVTIQAEPALTNATIRLISITGQLLLDQPNRQGSVITLDLGRFPAGVYFVEISTEGKTARMKLVKE